MVAEGRASGGQGLVTYMNKTSSGLDSEYLQKKRRQLLALRDELRAASQTSEGAENAVRGEAALQAHEFEDDAQKLDRLEREGELVSRSLARLEQVERALAKIDNGTYGFSDVSGEPIPQARLDAMPDATHTFAEQEALERPAD